MTNRYVLRLIFALQFVCALFFISDIVISVLGLRMRPIEIGAAVGLSLGTVLGAVALFRSQAKTNRIEGQLRAASGAFAELLDENFDQWALTPAERDVAWFAIKGMSTQEIAALRSTSEGTVKAQSNAIYRKAGVSGRYQLLGLFVDELMADVSIVDVQNGKAAAKRQAEALRKKA
jgi:DNA-binding CsgD family transcriptional regulator